MTARRRVLAAAGLVVGVLVAQEAIVRAAIPAPALVEFHRLRYATASPPEARAVTLARRALWWVSEPDGAAFVRHTNLYGFRDREWRIRPGDEPRVALFGDSFVEGLGAPDGGTLVDHLRTEAAAAGVGVELMSFGAGGFGVPEIWALAVDAVERFKPDHVVVVFYANDFYTDPPPRPPPPSPPPRLRSPWHPRLAYAWRLRAAGQRVPTRWREAAGEPRPLDAAARLRADPSLREAIDRFADPELRDAMIRGTLNPAVVNLLVRSERMLPRPVDVGPLVRGLQRLGTGAPPPRLHVAYLPSLNQVSDRYLVAQGRLSAPIAAPSLTGHPFQQQARDLRAACRRAGVPFLDLTPHLRRLEEQGERLYWPFDGHMNAAGYAGAAEALTRRWLPGWFVAPRRTAQGRG